MVAAEALNLVGARIDDVEELAAHWDYPVTRGVLRRCGADQSEVKRDGHIAALVHGERYIAVSAVTLVHGRLQGVNRISQMPGTGDQTQP
ncbi:hypothetical protein AWM69_20005 [Pseudomonas sp. D1HM]|nr:hypothetical protein [Pseudomonas sp. D1HM]